MMMMSSDQCVPEGSDLALSPDQSPQALAQAPTTPTGSKELKSPARLQNGEGRHSKSSSPCILGTRPSPSCSESDTDSAEDGQLLVMAKRRKLNYDSPNYAPSPPGSPPNCAGTPNASLLDSFHSSQYTTSTDTSALSTPGLSPSQSLSSFLMLSGIGTGNGISFRGRYKKDELWPAIKGDYQFLMDEEIIETCKSTESDLSWESDDVANNATTVSFNEFLQQYKELTDWLTHIQSVTQRQSSSLSEKYLNQTYHEEMLKRSPRRKLFNDYAKQLMRRYPDRKDEIQLRLQHLNKQWEALEQVTSPHGGCMDEDTMHRDLEQDLNGLCKWLHGIEERLQPLTLHPDWTTSQLLTQLQEHQNLQHDLEAHSKIVSAILKLCERLANNPESKVCVETATNKRLLAADLERRWHVILLQSLEWQCRLEEAIKNGIKKRPELECPSSPESDDNQSAYTSYKSDQSTVCYQSGVYNTSKDLTNDGLDSDNSNFDVIPFSESEYEKITIDTDVPSESNLTDGDDKGSRSASVTIPPRKSINGETNEGVEHGGTDSALGRSVSDHSINTEQRPTTCHYFIKLSHDSFRQALNKAVASRESLAMRAAQEPSDLPRGSPARAPKNTHKPNSFRNDNNDVGYSSESHSNEEPECQRHNREINGNVVQNQTCTSNSEGIQNPKLRVPSARLPESTWRHSITSAYDTSSNCSDLNNSADDREHHRHDHCQPASRSEMKQATVPEELCPENSIRSLPLLPNQHFYQMITIETDSEATSTAEKNILIEESKSGAATDADSELSRSLELPYDETPIHFISESRNSGSFIRHSAKAHLDAVFEKVEPLETPVGSPESQEQVLPLTKCASDGDQSMDENFAHPMSDSSESNALFEMEVLNSCRSLLHNSYCDNSLKFPEDKTDAGDCVSRLLHQASLLACESFTAPISIRSANRHTNRGYKTKSSGLNQSFTSTDGSVLPTDGSVPNAHSTCEASSEGTSESSESDEEFSSTSSASEVEEEEDDEPTLQGSKSADATLCLNYGTSRHGGIRKLKRSRGKTQLTNVSVSSNLDNIQYSVSEGALNDLKRYQSQHKLRRTTSAVPLYPSQLTSTPRGKQRRHLRRNHSTDTPSKLSVSPIHYLHSQSLPTSQVQSSRSQSRSLSPDSLNYEKGDQIDRTTVLSEQLVPTGGIIGTETEDEAVHHSLTSAAEFSENAWDNLHHIYPYISSDPGEEKLDASEFQKDWDFQNNCNADTLAPPSGEEKNSMLSACERSKSRMKEKRSNSSKLSTTSYIDDSDSDLEDVHYVIEESYKAIKFTENTLKKFRRDNMETGIFIDPSEYDAPLETCKEHIVCLNEILNVLEAKTGPEADLEEIQEISDMITKWEELGHLAGERQKQSKYLANIYNELVGIKSSLQTVTDEVDKACFEDINDLKQCIKLLQENKMELCHYYQQKLPKLVESLTDFENHYPDLKMARFDEEIALLQHRLEAAVDMVTARSSELQNILLSWYDFGETQRELEYLLGREKYNLDCLEGAEDIITRLFSLEDLNCTIHDLQALDTEMSHYGRKLEALRLLQREITKVYSHQDIKDNIEQLEKLFLLLRTKCRGMAAKIQTKLEKVDKQTQAALMMESANDVRLSSFAEGDGITAGDSGAALLWRLMKIALPVQLAVVIGFCLLCLYDPAYGESITKFNLIFSPHLSYVDGPPPR